MTHPDVRNLFDFDSAETRPALRQILTAAGFMPDQHATDFSDTAYTVLEDLLVEFAARYWNAGVSASVSIAESVRDLSVRTLSGRDGFVAVGAIDSILAGLREMTLDAKS